MVFAAGFGTRMGALTANRPKPLLEVQGISLLQRAIDQLRRAGVTRIVVNTHYHADQVKAAVGDDVTLSYEPEILETGGGLQAALRHFDPGPVLTANPDALWAPGTDAWGTLSKAWDPARADACLLLVPRSRAQGSVSAGDFFLGPDGQLTRRGAHDHAPFIYSGLQVLNPARLTQMERGPFSLNVLWNRFAVDGRLSGTVLDADWVDVGRPEGLELANRMMDDADV